MFIFKNRKVRLVMTWAVLGFFIVTFVSTCYEMEKEEEKEVNVHKEAMANVSITKYLQTKFRLFTKDVEIFNFQGSNQPWRTLKALDFSIQDICNLYYEEGYEIKDIIKSSDGDVKEIFFQRRNSNENKS